MSMTRREKGNKVLHGKYEKQDLQMIEKLREISPDFVDQTLIDYAFGDIWSRDKLATRDKEIVTIAALISIGSVLHELKGHFHTSLNIGLTKDEIIEIIILSSVYVGIPKCINALLLLDEVMQERELKNKTE